jgi:hypothetical protein
MRSSSVLLLFALVLAAPLGASPIFTGIVRDALELSSAPPCTLCHATQSGGAGTATQPVVLSLMELGFVGNDPDSLLAALTELKALEIDSDGDGMSDVDELREGRDPNSASEAPSLEGPLYGFGCQGASSGEAALYSSTLLGLFLLRRRRARHGPLRR